MFHCEEYRIPGSFPPRFLQDLEKGDQKESEMKEGGKESSSYLFCKQVPFLICHRFNILLKLPGIYLNNKLQIQPPFPNLLFTLPADAVLIHFSTVLSNSDAERSKLELQRCPAKTTGVLSLHGETRGLQPSSCQNLILPL